MFVSMVNKPDETAKPGSLAGTDTHVIDLGGIGNSHSAGQHGHCQPVH